MDEAVRFAGIADNLGKIVAYEYREGLAPLMTIQESEMSVIQSVIRMGLRRMHEEKLGRTLYAVAAYEKVKRATIPLADGSFLMISFDIPSDHESIILRRVLPLIKEKGLFDGDTTRYMPTMEAK
ncbi:MAG: hypothetical protein C4291_15630 [Candidatus Dadabacteria bacterium]